MRSSIDKRRDMARSILPSTDRAPGRGITAVKRANRRATARRLRAPGVDDWDDELDAVDPCAYPDRDIGRYVQQRRYADKLNHFQRWAVAVTRDLPREDRLSALAAGLPRGLVGDHALSHLRALPELRSGPPPVWQVRHEAWWAAVAARKAREERAAERRRALLVALLAEPEGHRSLNAAMKTAACDCPGHGERPPRRTLAGVHDVDAFLADVASCHAWRAALAGFLDGGATGTVAGAR
jgi:hypothetical protein